MKGYVYRESIKWQMVDALRLRASDICILISQSGIDQKKGVERRGIPRRKAAGELEKQKSISVLSVFLMRGRSGCACVCSYVHDTDYR